MVGSGVKWCIVRKISQSIQFRQRLWDIFCPISFVGHLQCLAGFLNICVTSGLSYARSILVYVVSHVKNCFQIE